MRGICKFCGAKDALIKAHIVPSSLYDKEKGQALQVFSSEHPDRPEKSWTGIYDKELVCRKCEDIWDTWDSYAAEFLRNIDSIAEPIHYKGELLGLRVEDYDYEKLKLFFLSVAWRCGASIRNEFSLVNLGPYEAILKNAIEANEPDHHAGLDVSINRFDNTEIGTSFLNPHCERWEGVNHLRIYMYGFTILVKLDKRPMPAAFRQLRMERNKPLYVAIRRFDGGPEHRLMLNMVRNESR